MATTRTQLGPSPHGGVKVVILFTDGEFQPAEEGVATGCEILEYDASDEVIFRTYGSINRDASAAQRP